MARWNGPAPIRRNGGRQLLFDRIVHAVQLYSDGGSPFRKISVSPHGPRGLEKASIERRDRRESLRASASDIDDKKRFSTCGQRACTPR